MGDDGGARRYSCRTASETLEWIHAIIDFLKPYRFLLDAHVVNFFKDRLWEAVDKEWMDCLRKEPVEKLLQLPSGVVQDHWPASLKEYVLKLKSLSLPRSPADLQEAFPGLGIQPLNNVISQGMNKKKKHEIEALAAVIGFIARTVGAETVVDVGSGQGYLAQVLSFEHNLSVIAIDASSHHGNITDARAKRIEKYYSARIRKSRSENKGFSRPKTVTCQVLSTAMLKDISRSLVQVDTLKKPPVFGENAEETCLEGRIGSESPYLLKTKDKTSLVLAGLHACGDLSVTMLRTFVECIEVKAVVSIGCCYNLLSEDVKDADQCGFPMSKGAKSASLQLGKSARDLACQSAERWKDLGQDAGLHNFELHLFRAAFQMVLIHYYPEIIDGSPAIGRQGKALRRQRHRKILESNSCIAESFSQNNCTCDIPYIEVPTGCTCTKEVTHNGRPPCPKFSDASHSTNRYSMFLEFCVSGLRRLGLNDSPDIDFSWLWEEANQFAGYVGPYWTIRAAMGPVLETLLLLDRLLFLQEKGNVRPIMLPLFDPVLSPRNMAFVAEKV